MNDELEEKGRFITVLFIIAANCFPLAGLAIWDWNVYNIVFLYWLESMVIGFYNVIKMLSLDEDTNIGLTFLFSTGYFSYLSVILFAICSLFGGNGFFTQQLTASLGALEPFKYQIALGAVSLVISHGISYFVHFIVRGERYDTDALTLFRAPFKRIVFIQILLLSSGWWIHKTHAGIFYLVLMVLLKIALDIHSHIQEHYGS